MSRDGISTYKKTTGSAALAGSETRVTGSDVDTNKRALDVIVFGGSGLNSVSWDFCDIQQTDSITETYVFKTGGSGGTTVKTIVIVYTDSSKANLDTVTVT